MSSSSLRKYEPRRTHHERCAPPNRSKFGILERHKDYKQRAKSYHFKVKRLDALRQAARFKNPDEFYFAMQNSQVIDGKHQKKPQIMVDKRDIELQALAESQSYSTIQAHIVMNRKQIKKLEERLIPPPAPKQHLFFPEDETDLETCQTRTSDASEPNQTQAADNTETDTADTVPFFTMVPNSSELASRRARDAVLTRVVEQISAQNYANVRVLLIFSRMNGRKKSVDHAMAPLYSNFRKSESGNPRYLSKDERPTNPPKLNG